jgi:hypothetical protein
VGASQTHYSQKQSKTAHLQDGNLPQALGEQSVWLHQYAGLRYISASTAVTHVETNSQALLLLLLLPPLLCCRSLMGHGRRTH